MSETPVKSETVQRDLRPGEAWWYCKSCNAVLGAVNQQDELDIKVAATATVRTLEGAVLVQCRRCHTVKTWFLGPEKAIRAAVKSIARINQDEMMVRFQALMQQNNYELSQLLQAGEKHVEPIDDGSRRNGRPGSDHPGH